MGIRLGNRRASFETPAARAPQDEGRLGLPLKTYLMLRSAQRARLEARKLSLQLW